MREINKIIVHVSDSAWGDAAIIRQWHKDRGWRDIGYHFVITNGRRTSRAAFRDADDGIVETGRPVKQAGAHVRGQNSKSIGICLIAKNWFTPKQFHELFELITQLRKKYGSIPVYGHNHFDKSKTCPNIEASLLAEIVEGGYKNSKVWD